MKTPNPNQGLNARKRRIFRNLRSQSFASVHPFRSQRLVDENDKVFKLRTYRDEIVAKPPGELLMNRLRGFSFRQLLWRRTQGMHALSRAEANHARAKTPADKGAAYPQVSRCRDFVSAVEAEIARRGSEAEHLGRLADLTPAQI